MQDLEKTPPPEISLDEEDDEILDAIWDFIGEAESGEL